jgi:undecaprenyl pyrophosphate phosphatase UppP
MLMDLQPLVRAGLPYAETLGRLGTGVFLYITPDQVLPLTSIFGAIIGVVLMFWNRVVGIARKAWHLVSRKKEAGS